MGRVELAWLPGEAGVTFSSQTIYLKKKGGWVMGTGSSGLTLSHVFQKVGKNAWHNWYVPDFFIFFNFV
jgi:hypothetical protein